MDLEQIIDFIGHVCLALFIPFGMFCWLYLVLS